MKMLQTALKCFEKSLLNIELLEGSSCSKSNNAMGSSANIFCHCYGSLQSEGRWLVSPESIKIVIDDEVFLINCKQPYLKVTLLSAPLSSE